MLVPTPTRATPDPPRVAVASNAPPVRTDLRSGQWLASYLAEATARFHSSLDVETVADQVLRSLVPRLVDAAVLHLWTPDRTLQPRAAAHVDAPLQDQLRRDLPALAMDSGDARRLLPTRAPVDGHDVRRLTRALADARVAAGLPPWPAGLAVAVPLPGDDAAIGVLHLLRRPDACPQLDELLPQLVARAGRALLNAAVAAEHATLTRELQRVVAPPHPDVVQGLRITSRYRAASRSTVAGGDFYDVHQTADGVMAVLGDIQGHGVPVATAAAMCRLAVRGLVGVLSDPADLLAAVDRALADHFQTDDQGGEGGGGRFATAVAVRLRPASEGGWDVTTASGGHPAPLVVGADGVRPVPVEGLLLGAFGATDRHEVQVRLLPGESLVLASDGVIGTAGHADELHRLLAAVPPGQPDRIADALMSSGGHDDDRSLLVISTSRDGLIPAVSNARRS